MGVGASLPGLPAVPLLIRHVPRETPALSWFLHKLAEMSWDVRRSQRPRRFLMISSCRSLASPSSIFPSLERRRSSSFNSVAIQKSITGCFLRMIAQLAHSGPPSTSCPSSLVPPPLPATRSRSRSVKVGEAASWQHLTLTVHAQVHRWE